MKFSNTNRSGGTRSSTSINPKSVLEDLDDKIRRLTPSATPMQTIGNYLGRGNKPRSHKIQTIQYHSFDNWDFCSAVELGSATASNLSRYANFTLDQPSRPDLTGQMYYNPQDKFWIVKTNQVVEVVMTPTSSILADGTNPLTLNAALTNGTTTTTAAGQIVVRNTGPGPITSFTTSDVVYLGRTIYESQNIEAVPAQRDLIYDCNFLEHKEKVINMTQDQKEIVKTVGENRRRHDHYVW